MVDARFAKLRKTLRRGVLEVSERSKLPLFAAIAYGERRVSWSFRSIGMEGAEDCRNGGLEVPQNGLGGLGELRAFRLTFCIGTGFP